MFNASPREMAKTADTREKLPAPQPTVRGTAHGRHLDKQPEKSPMTPDNRTKFVMNRATLYHMENLRDRTLWDTYREDFDGWTLNEFHACQTITLCKFRDLLRYRGVFVAIISGLLPTGPLYDVLQEIKQATWTKEDIDEHIEEGGRFNSDTVKHFMIKNNIPIPPDIPPSEVSSEKPFSEPPSPCPEPRELHVTSILSPTLTELRKLVENLIDEPAFAEPTKKASDDAR
jgi:hypothetical protein